MLFQYGLAFSSFSIRHCTGHGEISRLCYRIVNQKKFGSKCRRPQTHTLVKNVGDFETEGGGTVTEQTPYERENRRGLHKGQRSVSKNT